MTKVFSTRQQRLLSAEMNSRRLKIYSKYIRRADDGVFRPEIRLRGNWLEDAGFHIGQSIQVTYEQGRIQIELTGESAEAYELSNERPL